MMRIVAVCNNIVVCGCGPRASLIGRLTLTGRAAALAGLAGLVFACEEPPFLATVTVSPGTAELPALATTVLLTAEVRDQYGQVMAGVPVTWSSGDASVATVDGSGLVTAVGNGTAAIGAEAEGVSGSATLTVAQVVSEVVLAPAADTLASLGDTVRLAAEARDANGHAVERVRSFAWSSGDASVATVDGSGLVTAVGNGTAAIGAEAEGVSGVASLTVAQVVSEVVVAPAADTLASLGDTVRLAAEARDANGNAVERVRSFAWSSGDASVATVDGSGLVTAVGNGTAAIGAEAEGVSGVASLTVAQVVSEVVVTPAADTLVSLGDTVRLAAEARDANGHAVERVRNFAWSSGDALVATVDGSGLVTAVGNGTAAIGAEAEGVSGSASLTVAQVVSEVVVTPAADTLVSLMDTLRLAAEARDANGNAVERVRNFAWSSGDALVATVDGSGLVTAVGNGTAAIGAEAEGVSGSASLTVAQVVSEVVVTPAADTLVSLMDTLRLAAEARDANGNAVERVRNFAWSSGDESVALVDETGFVTAMGAGTVAITAEAKNVAGTASVTVDQEVRDVVVRPGAMTLAWLADTVRVRADAWDGNGFPVAEARLNWSSGDTSVATVDGSGLVTSRGNGTAIVRAEADGAYGTTSVTVEQVVHEVVVTPAADTLISLDDTLRLEAEARDANGYAVAAAQISWLSYNPMIATVDASGMVTSVDNGTVAIRAFSEGELATASVTVDQLAAEVVVTPASGTLVSLGDKLRLVAIATDANRYPIVEMQASWMSVDPSVATVDSSGLVTSVDNGTATVMAVVDSTFGKASVKVAQRVSEVVVAPASGTLVSLGDTLRLAAEAADANGHAVAGARPTWSSGDETVATVDGSGLVTSVGNGRATITALADGVSDGASVKVAQRVSGLVVTPASDTLVSLGDTLRLVAEATDANGHAVAGAGARLVWSSSDETVATVDGSGLVTSVGDGRATITALADGVSDGASVKVAQRVSEVVVAPAFLDIIEDDTARLDAEAADANGHPVEGVRFAWSSGDETVATVDGSGLVTAVDSGTVTITAEADGVEGESEITVRPGTRVTEVVVTPAFDTLFGKGDTVRLEAEARDADGNEMVGVRFAWSSGDETVATVDGSGLVTAVDSGTVTITAEADGVEGESEITVRPGTRVTEVVVTPAFDTLFGKGDTVRLEAEARDADGNEMVGVRFTWSSGDETVATVDGSGLVTAVDSGTVTVTAEADGVEGESEITVRPGTRVTEVVVTPAFDTLFGKGDTVRLEAEARDADGNEMGGVRFAWSSGDETVATVDGSGLVTAVDSGTVTITAEADGVEGESEITVRPGTRVTEVVVTPAFDTLFGKGDTVRLEAEARDADGNEMVGVRFTWSSGDETVATVDGSGLVTAVDSGTVTITAEADGVEGESEITVRPGTRVTEVVVTPAFDTLFGKGDTVQLEAEARDADGNEMGGVRFAWSSGDETVATVDGSGLVTSVGKGTATVTAEAEGVEGESEITVQARDNPADRATLEALYNAMGGPQWNRRDNWLSDLPLRDWHGVDTDDDGSVTLLLLGGNGLTGAIPAELGDLAALEVLFLQNNRLSGAVPPELGDLSRLQWLRLAHSQLSGAIPPELGRLSNLEKLDLYGNRLTDPIPAELGKLSSLEWLELGGNRLSGSIPAELGDLSELTVLRMGFNRLSGSIPAELGKLSSLEELHLYGNQLTGAIPAELGSAAQLQQLNLFGNRLSGSIPAELGDLSELRSLFLYSNRLSGSIPAELGDLSELRILFLEHNELSGAIPRELGKLGSLELLEANNNRLSGPVPAELGDLGNLQVMRLHKNNLEGTIPSAFGSLGSLTALVLTGNTEMSGVLSDDLTSLEVDTLLAGGTGLCLPREPAFEDWVTTIRHRRIGFCEGATAYLTQAVQSRTHPVPLVADERALLRVFVTATKKTSEGIPLVRARFYLDETEDTVVDIPGKSTPIPTEVDEGDLAKSANVEIPGVVVQPGLEMVIEIDPDDELDEDLLVTKRIPETGRMALDVRDMPTLELTVVPFLWTQDPDSAVLDATADMEEDPDEHELLSHTRTLLPVVDLDVEAHDAVESSSNHSLNLVSQTQAMRSIEGGTGHWMGTMTGRGSGPSGVAPIPGWTLFSILRSNIIAHELAHNMNLRHAPCGGAGSSDPHYPRGDGSTGAWGYDFESESLVPPTHRDLMTYCVPRWISDYHFTKMVGHRLSHPQARRSPTTARSLLLWGGATPEGDLVLNPAIVVDAPTALPEADGDHRIAGLTADSTEIFSIDFEMPELSEGGSAFAFVLPLQPGWSDSVAIIALTGPDGEAALTMETDRPVAIVRDSRTGQVRAFLRGDAAVDAQAGPSAERGVVVRFSRGIPWSGEERR